MNDNTGYTVLYTCRLTVGITICIRFWVTVTACIAYPIAAFLYIHIHNIATLDGLNTFHGIGIISMSTPCSSVALASHKFGDIGITRRKCSKVAEMVRNRGIHLFSYDHTNKSELSLLTFKSVDLLKDLCVQNMSHEQDMLFHIG